MKIVAATEEGWQFARAALRGGQLVVFPTDTVYGIGCDPYDVQAILAIYHAKGRSFQKALPLLLSGVESIVGVARSVPECARKLGEAFWPGAITLVVPRNPSLPAELGGGDSIAVRVPDHPGLRDFIASCGGYIAATSANASGQPDALDARQAADYFGESVAVIVDGGRVRGGVPSTVVDCISRPPAILRAGALSEQQVQSVLATVK